MEIEFGLTQSLEENAGKFFDLAKRYKKKLQGANQALQESRKQLLQLQKEEAKYSAEEKIKQQKKQRKQQWYEKFHWFISSEGFLCIGGKDATSNEIIIKKHLEPDDLVLHTDMAGSPFFVIKNGKEAGQNTIQETAQAVAVYSRAWKLGHTTADVFYVQPEQVTKETKTGENIAKGSFMIYGKTNYLYPKLEYALGLFENEIIGGPWAAVIKRTDKVVLVVPGREKKSALAKKIRAKLGGGDLDDIIKFLPAGGGDLKKVKENR